MTQLIGRYEVVELIGEGGMGQVLKAWDPKLGQFVAMKVINPALLSSKKVLIRAQRELQVMLSLRSHPNIVTVLDYVEEPFALVMELLVGEELAEIITRHPQGLEFDAIYAISAAMVGAVGFAHEKGILHRDMKPGNIMCMELAQRREVKVLDFGLAGFLSSDIKLTRTGARMGTPGYMAPEQHLGAEVDARTDIYALGVILFEMATGETPFQAHTDTDYQLMKAQLELPMPRPSAKRPDLPAALEEIILKATARSPEHRYQDAGAFLADLKRAQYGGAIVYGLRNQPVAPTPASPPAPATIFEEAEFDSELDAESFQSDVSSLKPFSHHGWLWGLLALSVVGLLFLFVSEPKKGVAPTVDLQARRASALQTREKVLKSEKSEVDDKFRESVRHQESIRQKLAQNEKQKRLRRQAKLKAAETALEASRLRSRRESAEFRHKASAEARYQASRRAEQAQASRQRRVSPLAGWCKLQSARNGCRPCNTDADCGHTRSSCWKERSSACNP